MNIQNTVRFSSVLEYCDNLQKKKKKNANVNRNTIML